MDETKQVYETWTHEGRDISRKDLILKHRFNSSWAEMQGIIDGLRIREEPKFRDKPGEPAYNHNELAELFTQKYRFMNINGELYYWNGTRYCPNGWAMFCELLNIIIPQEKLTRNKKLEIKEAVFSMNYKRPEDLKEMENNAKSLVLFENGVYDLAKGEFRKNTPEDMITAEPMPVGYVPDASCPVISKFLAEVVEPDNNFLLYQIAGFCLLNQYKHKKAFLLLGEGNNGKSVYLSLLTAFLGKENVSDVPLQNIGINRFASSKLYGKRANIAADMSRQALFNVGTFKMAVGRDYLYAEKKGKDGFEFMNNAKLIFSANYLPEGDSKTELDKAFFDRWVIIKFPRDFVKEGVADKNLIDRLTTPQELSGFAVRALEALKMLEAKGDFEYTKGAEAVRAEWLRNSNSILAFLSEATEAKEGATITKEALYDAYQGYCEEHNLTPETKEKLGRELSRTVRGVKTRQIYAEEGRRPTAWCNIALKSNSEEVQNQSINERE